MKYLLFLILLIIYCAKGSCSNGFMSETERIIDFCEVSNNNIDYISYEFGFSKIISVYIVKNDAQVDVYFSDGNKVNFSTTCDISPILKWAFEKAPNESSSVRFVENKKYESLYYKLTAVVKGTPTIIDSSSMRIIGNDAFLEKIEELKGFIISLWIDSLESQIKNSSKHLSRSASITSSILTKGNVSSITPGGDIKQLPPTWLMTFIMRYCGSSSSPH